MIYFVQPVNGGPVKIGTTINIEARMVALEWAYGCPLALLATAPGSRGEERLWHERFAHLRFGRTEQFRPAAELMEAIGRPLLVDPNPEAVEAIPFKRFSKFFTVKSSGEWAEWLEKLAKRYRTTVAGVIDRALAEWTEAQGYEEKPPERTS